ncbi:MAG: hypothetical protein ONB30_02495 [candidate division KSB1 bacterium]|nr:hypothetical protein [candidate division KSB1 bacterium]
MRKGYLRLRSIQDVCRFLSRLINEARVGETEVGKASRLAYMANILLGALRDSKLEDLEARIEKLELERQRGGLR